MLLATELNIGNRRRGIGREEGKMEERPTLHAYDKPD